MPLNITHCINISVGTNYVLPSRKIYTKSVSIFIILIFIESLISLVQVTIEIQLTMSLMNCSIFLK